jgi:hypothetical protein
VGTSPFLAAATSDTLYVWDVLSCSLAWTIPVRAWLSGCCACAAAGCSRVPPIPRDCCSVTRLAHVLCMRCSWL